MKIIYKHKDETFDDIRDIVQNNMLVPDYKYIFEEYLPFQLCMTGRTFFKDVTMEMSYVSDEFIAFNRFDRSYFEEAIDKYFTEHDFDIESRGVSPRSVLALSGGIDSSALALVLKPPVVYSGYYDDPDCDETPQSSLIANQIDAVHITEKLDESDFIRNYNNCMQAICTPVGGMGSVMEYALLAKVKEALPSLEAVVFGNGGDEIFLGYWLNHFPIDFLKCMKKPPKNMENFFPAQIKLVTDLVEVAMLLSLNKAPGVDVVSTGLFRRKLKLLRSKPDIIHKILYANTNFVLPVLLHLVNQICRAHGVKSFNPLANSDLIYNAGRINTSYSDIPKNELRKIFPDMPDEIRNNFVKRGFPMPYEDWSYLDTLMRIACTSFCSRKVIKQNIGLRGLEDQFVYEGINRFTWGIFQAETWFRIFRD